MEAGLEPLAQLEVGIRRFSFSRAVPCLRLDYTHLCTFPTHCRSQGRRFRLRQPWLLLGCLVSLYKLWDCLFAGARRDVATTRRERKLWSASPREAKGFAYGGLGVMSPE